MNYNNALAGLQKLIMVSPKFSQFPQLFLDHFAIPWFSR